MQTHVRPSIHSCFWCQRLTFPYREGISTTALIQRILRPELPLPDQAPLLDLLHAFAASVSPPLAIFDLMADPARNAGMRAEQPVKRKRIGYIGGSWDCFGAAHVERLREAREMLIEKSSKGDEVTLIVGVWTDEVRKRTTVKT